MSEKFILNDINEDVKNKDGDNQDLIKNSDLFDSIKNNEVNEIQTETKQKLSNLKIDTYQNIVNQIEVDLKNIQEDKNGATSLQVRLIEKIIGPFMDQTPSEMYEASFNSTKQFALKMLIRISQEFQENEIPNEQKLKLIKLQNQLKTILKNDISDVGLYNLTKNEILNIPENVSLAMHGVKGEVFGILNGVKNVISGAGDLLVFVGKLGVSGEYRHKIKGQINQIYEFCVKNGLIGMKDKVGEILSLEMKRVGTLPTNEQAEAIGNIGGNVISILLTMKVGMSVANKLKGFSNTGSIGSNVQEAGLHVANATINGPEDYLLKGAKVLPNIKGKNQLKGTNLDTGELPTSDLSVGDNISDTPVEIDTGELTSASDLSVGDNISDKAANISEVYDFDNMSIYDIGKLEDIDRIKAADHYLGKKLNDNQKSAIIEAHNIGEDRIDASMGNYNFSEIRQKHKILKKAGFNTDEIRVLMEKGVCGRISNLFKKEVVKKAKDFHLVDILDKKGEYEISKIDGLKVMKAHEKIEEFTNNIDSKYLINHPRRINDMLDIIKSMCEYIDNNSIRILNFGDNRLYNYRNNFTFMRNKLISLTNNKDLNKTYQDTINKAIKDYINKTHITLNPSNYK